MGVGTKWVGVLISELFRVQRASGAHFRYTFGLRGAPCLCGP